jgi:hypothetical protein
MIDVNTTCALSPFLYLALEKKRENPFLSGLGLAIRVRGFA